MNYQQTLDQLIKELNKKQQVPTLLLHSCCAPCSSYVLEYLSQYFKITVLYYNPNIYPKEEYDQRVMEQERFILEFPAKHPISFLSGRYLPDEFFHLVKGHEKDPEGGERCYLCYRQRLTEAAFIAKENGFDYFTTTLSISPLKNATWINEIGEKLANEYGIPHLTSDFKKKNGYKRSTELSKEYGLYRQSYCGCIYSKAEMMSKSDTV